jgi:hypothetical protein
MYHAAMYSSALTPTQISNNAAILADDDDTP